MINSALPGRITSLDIVTGSPHVIEGVTRAIEQAGVSFDRHSPGKLIVDAPVGYALHALRRLDFPECRTIVTTINTCPEYVEDLWDCDPDALLAGTNLALRLPEVILHLERGERFRLTPGCKTELTPSERLMLRYLVHGWSNQHIADRLNLQSKTVMNTLTSVYSKLNVNGREEAILHYWNVWHTPWE